MFAPINCFLLEDHPVFLRKRNWRYERCCHQIVDEIGSNLKLGMVRGYLDRRSIRSRSWKDSKSMSGQNWDGVRDWEASELLSPFFSINSSATSSWCCLNTEKTNTPKVWTRTVQPLGMTVATTVFWRKACITSEFRWEFVLSNYK